MAEGSGGVPLWQIAAVVIVPLVAIAGGFWQLADPRSDIRQIKADYLTIREHTEFKTRTEKIEAEILQANRDQETKFATVRDMTQRDQLRDNAVAGLQRQIDQLLVQTRRLRDDLQAHERLDRQIERQREIQK